MMKKWLLSRLLTPAGILPPALTYDDLKYNEQSRQKIGNLGFEYFYMLHQDPKRINTSAIGKKIFALHAPWPVFAHEAASSKFFQKAANFVIFTINKKLPTAFIPMAESSFRFGAKLEAKIITFHISFFDHHKLLDGLKTLHGLEEKYKVTAAIEHDGPYIVNWGQQFYFKRLDGSYDWMTNPVKLQKILWQLYPRKKFGLCLDSASLIGQGLPVVETTRKIISSVVHVHLAGSAPGSWLTTDINSQEIVDIVRLLYKHHYPGYITAEVNATAGKKEESLARIYAFSSLFGLPLFKNSAVQNAQRHLENSCEYLVNNL